MIAAPEPIPGVRSLRAGFRAWQPALGRSRHRAAPEERRRARGFRPLRWEHDATAPAHDDRPAIAVLSFIFLGEDASRAYLAVGVTRRFTRLTDYEAEVSNARVWAGFHYRFSTDVGRDMGHRIAARTLATQLKPKWGHS